MEMCSSHFRFDLLCVLLTNRYPKSHSNCLFNLQNRKKSCTLPNLQHENFLYADTRKSSCGPTYYIGKTIQCRFPTSLIRFNSRCLPLIFVVCLHPFNIDLNTRIFVISTDCKRSRAVCNFQRLIIIFEYCPSL